MGPRPRAVLAGGALVVGALQGPAGLQDPPAIPPIPQPILASLESAARNLGKAARRAEALEVADVLAALGQPSQANEKLRAACLLEAGKAPSPPPKPPLSDAARGLRTASQSLAKILKVGNSPALAEAILRIDGNCAEARAALGFERVHGAWLTEEGKKLAARRAEIQDAIRRARVLEVPLEVSESSHPGLLAATGGKGVQVRYAGLRFHAAFSAAKVSRMVRESLRAVVLSRWLVTNQWGLPELGARNFLLLTHKPHYVAALEDAKKKGGLDAKTAEESAALSAFYDNRGYMVDLSITEADLETAMLAYLTDYDGEQPPLEAGHLSWVSLAYVGAPLPGWAWKESSEGGAGGRAGTSADPNDATVKEREEMLRLSKAGIAGSRSWMSYLAERREDPPLSRSMVDQMGKIVGDDLLKCTFVAEFLQERGPLDAAFRATKPGGDADRGPAALAKFAKYFGEPVPAFEERWRRWLLRDRLCLLDRLDAKDSKALSPAEEDCLKQLNSLRARAFAGSHLAATPPVGLDRKLSDGARLHALYLGKHPEQTAAWPDAHEEYPDKEDFTTEGSWAGLHSVIAPGCATPGEALQGWIGTFYHRIPLLAPGLMRVGFALEKKCAVLDSGSIAAPPSIPFEVVWPPSGASDVPTHFVAELPNPVPGEDQGRFGYPVTLQVGLAEPGGLPPEYELRLFQGNESGTAMDCWWSTPQKPTNPDCAPAAAYCLIPKNPLHPRTRYTVVATPTAGGKRFQWSFTTQ